MLHIYVRVSTKEQKDNNTSLGSQKKIGEELSQKLGIKFKVWDEGSQSSFKDDLDNRPVLMNLLNEVDKGQIQKLYVWNTDRLSRNQKVWGLIRYKLKTNNVLLYVGSDSNPIDLSDPMDDLLIGLLSEISQYDNKLRMERFRIGRIERVKNGYWFGGPPPFGYEIQNKKLVPNEFESKWVNYIFESYNQGNTIDKIRNDLFVNGVKSRRGNLNWSNGSIEKLFQNTHFEGWYQMTDKKSGETFKIECSPIVPIGLINKVRKKREERSYKKGMGRMSGGNTQRDYLLKGLLECGYCGSKFGGRTVTSQYINHYYCLRKETNYRHKRTEKYVECKRGRRTLKVPVIDEIVWNKVIDIVKDSFLFKENEKNLILNERNFKTDTNEIEKLEKRINQYNRELKNIENNIIQLESDKILRKRSEKEINGILKNVNSHRVDILSKKEHLLNLIKGNKKEIEWVDWLDEFSSKMKDIKKTKDLNIKQKFLNGLIDRIIVNYEDNNTHNLRIFFKIPYIGDTLIWRNQNNKKLGYDIKKGLKSLCVNYNGNKLKKTEILENV